MKRITDDQSKMDLVARLVKDGAIDFIEAIMLLEVEVITERVTISAPAVDRNPFVRRVTPPLPYQPPMPWEQPRIVFHEHKPIYTGALPVTCLTVSGL